MVDTRANIQHNRVYTHPHTHLYPPHIHPPPKPLHRRKYAKRNTSHSENSNLLRCTEYTNFLQTTFNPLPLCLRCFGLFAFKLNFPLRRKGFLPLPPPRPLVSDQLLIRRAIFLFVSTPLYLYVYVCTCVIKK